MQDDTPAASPATLQTPGHLPSLTEGSQTQVFVTATKELPG